ncbi:alkaline phosphatase PhoX [Pseudomonas aeruginosa]
MRELGRLFLPQDELPRELTRYGIPAAPAVSAGKPWRTTSSDADATAKNQQAQDDYCNEPNSFGWIVEIDPFDPQSVPVKRTALGRFAHEEPGLRPSQAGPQVVCYSGDDSQNENYIYKLRQPRQVPSGSQQCSPARRGTLCVARFSADGGGQWLPPGHRRRQLPRGLSQGQVSFADRGEC